MERRTISIEGTREETDLYDFIHDNTDPGVEPLDYYTISNLCGLSVGEKIIIDMGAGGQTTIKRVR